MKHKPLILDLFCGAGGAAEGYSRVGFAVHGIDIARQKNYPYWFTRCDALEYLEKNWQLYDAFHASPPCQAYSEMKAFVRHEYPRLIASVRELLMATGKPYVIENVEGARSELRNPITLCGAMFPEIRTYRHRLFESNVPLSVPYFCNGKHNDNTPPAGHGISSKGFISITGNGGAMGLTVPYMEYASMAMGINWMTRDEIAESFPPQYTHWIGAQIMEYLGAKPLSYPEVTARQETLF